MFYIFILIGVVALISGIYLFVDGLLSIVSRNKIRKGLFQIAGSILALLLSALMMIFIAGMLSPAAP